MKCLLDLDGVLVDFVGGMCRAHCRANPYDEDRNSGQYEITDLWGMSATEFWEPADAEFWAGLEMCPDGHQILEACVSLFGTDNVCLLTSPSLNEGATDGKVRWIYENLPAFKRQFLVGAAKEFCAHERAVLVDDYDSNVEKFRRHGGRAVLVPRPWNTRHESQSIAAGLVAGELSNIVNEWRAAA